MNYQVRKLDFTWMLNAGTLGGAVVGLVLAMVGYRSNSLVLLVAGSGIYSAAVLAITRPVLSGLLGILGLFGGVLTFFLLPNPEVGAMPALTKLFATLLFTVLYTVLMDTLLVVGSKLYNLLIQGLGLKGISVELAAEEAEQAAAAEVEEVGEA